GARRAAALLPRRVPPQRLGRGERAPRVARQRIRGDLHHAHEARPALRPAPRSWQRAKDGGRRAARLGGAKTAGRKMIDKTIDDIPGYEVDEVFGEVMGLTVRSRNIGSQMGAGLKSIFGGELKGMTKALVDSREQVRQRMIEEAETHGANAIIAMRFD